MIHFHLFGSHMHLFCIFYFTSFILLLFLPSFHSYEITFVSRFPYRKLYTWSPFHLRVPSEAFSRVKLRLLTCADIGHRADQLLSKLAALWLRWCSLCLFSCLLDMSPQIVHSPGQWSTEASPPPLTLAKALRQFPAFRWSVWLPNLCLQGRPGFLLTFRDWIFGCLCLV